MEIIIRIIMDTDNTELIRGRGKSGYKHVTTQSSYNGRWKAMIPGGEGKMIPGGLFDDPREAAIAVKDYCNINNIPYL